MAIKPLKPSKAKRKERKHQQQVPALLQPPSTSASRKGHCLTPMLRDLEATQTLPLYVLTPSRH